MEKSELGKLTSIGPETHRNAETIPLPLEQAFGDPNTMTYRHAKA